MNRNLIQKYNIPGPRYTSYPTVPYWEESLFTKAQWKESFRRSFQESNSAEGISLYIHLPFCESLCTFCACNKRITKNHSVEERYIQMLLKEWNLYLKEFDEKPIIKEIHLGGGTPTFFSEKNLKKLLQGIFEKAAIHSEREFSFEGHPNNTSQTHLQTLHDLGFRRVSFGVQDYDPKVQKAINRIQPFEKVEAVTRWSRAIGYESVSHDLVFGLPFQTESAMRDTIEKTQALKPDRISFYSYAHVPWIKGVGQRGFNDEDLPSGAEKRALYELGKETFESLGYTEIGMDHFALPHDSMYQSMKNQSLHRNFMGYTSSKTQLMIGLGVSSISDSWYAFAQNEKSLEAYYERIENNELAVFRGHILTEEDLYLRQQILNLMCHFSTEWTEEIGQFINIEEAKNRLSEMQKDGLITFIDNGLKVSEEGKSFIRNVCMAFDKRMLHNQPETSLFSMTV